MKTGVNHKNQNVYLKINIYLNQASTLQFRPVLPLQSESLVKFSCKFEQNLMTVLFVLIGSQQTLFCKEVKKLICLLMPLFSNLSSGHFGTPIRSPWRTCLANKHLELHASRNLLISFSFIEGFSTSTSSESLGNFNEFLVIFFLLISSEQTTNLYKGSLSTNFYLI